MVGERTVNVSIVPLTQFFHLDKTPATKALDLLKGIDELGYGLIEREDESISHLLDQGIMF